MDQVWSTDITYIPVCDGFFYLTAVIDWYSRYILSWQLSNSLDGAFCREVVVEALGNSRKPLIFNTDQGSQYTSKGFTKILEDAQIQVSMDGHGRALDNVWIERFWRTLKYEEVYIRDYIDGIEAYHSLASYINFYNYERPHSSLGNESPGEVYKQRKRDA